MRRLSLLLALLALVALAVVHSDAHLLDSRRAHGRRVRDPVPPPTPSPSGGSSAKPAQALDLASFGAGPVVFVTAHPDDVEAAAGGLIAQLRQGGTEVFYVILTNGDKGCGNPSICNDTVSSAQIAQWRAEEARAAAGVLGVPGSNVFLLNYEDAMLTSYPEAEVRQRITAVLRGIKPVALFAWHPYPIFTLSPSEGWYDLGFHADHQASGRLAIDSKSNSGTERMWPEFGAVWPIAQLYLFDFVAPTHFVDISKVLALKIKAFNAHESQVPDPAFVGPFLTNIAAMVANTSTIAAASSAPGAATVQYAEGFLAYF